MKAEIGNLRGQLWEQVQACLKCVYHGSVANIVGILLVEVASALISILLASNKKKQPQETPRPVPYRSRGGSVPVRGGVEDNTRAVEQAINNLWGGMTAVKNGARLPSDGFKGFGQANDQTLLCGDTLGTKTWMDDSKGAVETVQCPAFLRGRSSNNEIRMTVSENSSSCGPGTVDSTHSIDLSTSTSPLNTIADSDSEPEPEPEPPAGCGTGPDEPILYFAPRHDPDMTHTDHYDTSCIYCWQRCFELTPIPFRVLYCREQSGRCICFFDNLENQFETGFVAHVPNEASVDETKQIILNCARELCDLEYTSAVGGGEGSKRVSVTQG